MPISIHVSVENPTAEEIQKLASLFSTQTHIQKVTVVSSLPEGVEKAITPAAYTPAAQEETGEAAPKRVRRTKAQIEADEKAAAEAAKAPEPTAAPSAESLFGDPPAEAAKAPTVEELRAALMAFNTKNGFPAAEALLKSVGASRISDLAELPADKQLAFMAAAKV